MQADRCGCSQPRPGAQLSMFRAINPATEEVLAKFPLHTPEEVAQKLHDAEQAWLGWRRRIVEQRGVVLKRFAAGLRARLDEAARTITLEMGKPIKQARAEVEKCALACDFY